MRSKFKRHTTLMILICMLFTLTTPIKAYAGITDAGNSGAGSSGGLTGSGTYSDMQSGYRMYLVDSNFKQVSNTVDLVFTTPSDSIFGNGKVDYYTGTRANGKWYTDSNEYTRQNIGVVLDDINKDKGTMFKPPSTPIKNSDNGGKTQGGEDFKRWFLEGLDTADYSSKQPSYSGNGITSPDISNGVVGNGDLPRGDGNMIVKNYGYRQSIKAEALDYVIRQGYYVHALRIIQSETDYIRDYISYFRMKGIYSDNDIFFSAINQEIAYLNNVTYSNAEAILCLSQIIDNVFGKTWVFGQPSNKFAYSISDDIDTIDIDDIPLAGDNFNGDSKLVCSSLLNYKDKDGTWLFNYNSYGKSIIRDKDIDFSGYEDTVVTKAMFDCGFYVVAEPIFWVKPKAVTGLTHPNYVYGTISNFLDFYAYHNYKYGEDGGWYKTMISKIGWSCMYYSEEIPGVKNFPKPFDAKKYEGTQLLPTLKQWKDENWAVAIHCYKTTGKPAPDYQVTGYNTWTYPSTAPDPNGPTKRNADGSVWLDSDGKPENKDYKIPPQGYEKEYNILKYYEDLYPDGTVEQVAKFIRRENPPQIDVRDEAEYKVRGWYTTKADLKDYKEDSEGYFECPEDDIYTYEQSMNKFGTIQKGDKATTNNPVFLDEKKLTSGSNGEKTLVVVLQRPIIPGAVDNPLTINESEISKAITTMDTNIPNWGPRDFAFSYASMSGSDRHRCGGKHCSGHSCSATWGDSSYNYIIWNSATLDPLLEANGAGGAFAFKTINNTMSGSASMGGGTNKLSTSEYQTTIWRGEDVPTIASYKESSSIELNNLLNKYGKQPNGSRALNGAYTKTFTAQFSVDSASDLQTHSVHSYNGSTWHTSTHSAPGVAPHTGDVTVNVYRGANKKSKGDSTESKKILTTTPFGNTSSIHSSGFMVQQDIAIQFYPYIRMTYQTTGDNTKKDVNILSQFYSSILPNDFAEAAWYNPNENESLTLSSVQWSLHAKAVNGGKDWNGANQVLPGGAIYQLSTQDYTSKVNLVTWQTILADQDRSKMAVDLPANAYTMTKANTEHNNYVEQAKQVLEGLRVVQWVNGNTKATNAWTNNGQAVKVTDGGEDLSSLGLSTKASTESKYRLGKDGTTDAANEGDLDIVSQSESTDTFFKVFSDTSGNIYFAKSVGNKSAIESLNGTNIGNAEKILSKKDKAESVASKLKGDAKEVNDRTNLITNYVKALERNTGNDVSASWAPDGKWYNEAFDGIMMVRKCTTLDVGFNNTTKRTASLDPMLCPKNNGVADMYSTAYLSQFKCNEYSEASIASGKGNGYIGTFQGKDIILEDMDKLYQSKKFYIPNATTQDLGN